MLYNLISTSIFYAWRKITKSKREKTQAFFLAISAILAIIVSTATDYIVGFMGFPPSFAPVTGLLWMLCVIYLIIRYRFLQLTPSLISNDIMNNIDELVILIDNNDNVIFINQKGKELFNNAVNTLDDLTGYISDFPVLRKALNSLMQQNKNFFYNRVFVKNDSEQIPIDINIKIIKDKFEDILGVLIIGKEAAGIGYLKKHFDLTSRQSDIIFYLVSGLTNKEIGDKLNLSETTVKGHITNIYSKLSISNRIGLQNLLLSCNIKIPKPLHKTSLLFDNK